MSGRFVLTKMVVDPPRRGLEGEMNKVCECDGVEKLLQECVDEIKLLEQDVNHAGEAVAARAREVESREKSMERKFKDFEERVKKFDLFREEKTRELELREGKLSSAMDDLLTEVKMRGVKVDEREKFLNAFIERLVVAHNRVEAMQAGASVEFEVTESWERKLEVAEKLVAKRVKKINASKRSLDERLMEIEKKESEFTSVQEKKMSDLLSKEKQLSIIEERLIKDIRSNEEILTEREKSIVCLMKKLEFVQTKVEGSSILVCKKFKEVESREQNVGVAEELMAKRVKEVDMIKTSLEKRIKEFENRENNLNIFEKAKMRELQLKEDQLSRTRKEFAKEAQLPDKVMTGQEQQFESAQDEVNCPSAPIDERSRKMGSQDQTFLPAPCAKDTDSIQKVPGKRLRDAEKRDKKSHCQNKKKKTMVLEEEKLSLMSKNFMKEVSLIDKNFEEQEKLVSGLIKRLELAQNDVEDLRKMASQRSNEISMEESDLERIRGSAEENMDEVDSRSEQIEEHDKEITAKEHNLVYKETDSEGKKKELESKEKNLQSWEKELEIKNNEVDSAQELIKMRSDDLDLRETSLKKKHLRSKKKLRSERDLVEHRLRDLKDRQKKLKYDLRELKAKKKQIEDDFKELDLKRQQSTNAMNAHVMAEPVESADLKFIVKMDGKTLQMFLNDPEKDTKSIGDEVFKVLHLSPDPAKLVLDAMEGFYPPHLREGDLDYNVRRTCILLLGQLHKMSKNIKPCVKEKALILASKWKSRMKTNPENLLEVLGFLHILAAYNLVPYFDKDEILSFIKMVAQHQQLPDLGIISATGSHPITLPQMLPTNIGT